MDLYFITDDEVIKRNLLEIGVKEKTSLFGTQEERNFLHSFILSRQKQDLCKGSDMFHYLMENLLDKENTTIFIHGGFEVLGLVNFKIIAVSGEKIMTINGICVPERRERKRGTMLLTILKQLAAKLHLKKIAVFSLPEAKRFYEKNGFIEEETGTNYMIYNLSKTDKSKTTSKSKTPTKSRSKTPANIRQNAGKRKRKSTKQTRRKI